MSDYPETPEAIALELMREILRREEGENDRPERRRNRSGRDEVLDLYAACLLAAHGDRASDGRTLQ
jgi:hypothetical protein